MAKYVLCHVIFFGEHEGKSTQKDIFCNKRKA